MEPKVVNSGTGDDIDSDPSRDDDLALREEADRVPPLGMKVPKEGVLHPPEGEVGHRGRDPEVNPDAPRPRAVPEVPGRLPTRRVDRRRVPVRAPVDPLDRLVEIVHLEDARHRPEDLLLRHGHVWRHAVEDRRADEVPVLVPAHLYPPPPPPR